MPVIQELFHGAQADASCTAASEFLGFKAEVLARAQKPEAAAALAEALAKSPDDAHAVFAAGYQKLFAGDLKASKELLTKAEQLGRGGAANAMLGILALRQDDAKTAKAAFESAIAKDPEEVDAMYNLAALEMARGVYNRPRTLFLKILKLRPDHLDARFMLATLTFRAGVLAEAGRHQALLEASAPTGDERVLKLRELMQNSAPVASASKNADPVELRMRKSATDK
jgi:tetratricopeptide (TPR) repeat protein